MANIAQLREPRFADIKTANRRYSVGVDFDLAAVASQWRELEAHGGVTPFQTQAWLLPWYRIIAPALDILPMFVTVRDQALGRPMMLLPLCLRRERGITTIKFPDCNVSDYNAPLLAPQFEPSEDEFAALWDIIARVLPRADLISLEKIPATVDNRPNPMARMAGARRMHICAWGFDLPKDRAAYDEWLNPDSRKKFRRERRYLEAEGPLRLVRAKSETHGREILEALRQQRHARCLELGRHDILGEPAYSRFYDTVIFDNWAKGFVALSAFMVGDEIAATMFGLNHRGRYYVLIHCFETGRWGSNSPGTVAIDAAITDQIEAGTKYFDLTIGNEPYKRKFGCSENPLYFWEQGLSPLGRACTAMRQARRFAGGQIRKLPEKYWPMRLKT